MMKPYDVIIVGAGVAGMTAAIYAKRAGKSVLVIESKVTGGQIVNALDVRNWPGEESISGQKLTERIYHQMNNLGVEVEYDEIEKIEKDGDIFWLMGESASEMVQVEDDDVEDSVGNSVENSATDGDVDGAGNGAEDGAQDGTYAARTVILATGSRDRPLGVPNEEKLVGHGISYCATCDGELYKGKDVLVVGGGNTAMYDVLYLAGLARKVYLVHRREEFRAEAALVEKVRKLENVEMILGATPKLVNDGEKVTGFYTVSVGGETDAEGATESRVIASESGTESTGDELVVNESGDESEKNEVIASEVTSADPIVKQIAAVFVAIGREPNTEKFAKLVKLDKDGYVVAGEDCKTSQAGVFAAGDCRTKGLRQLVTAAGDGATAATAAVEYLNQLERS